jgi:hypothetical protein
MRKRDRKLTPEERARRAEERRIREERYAETTRMIEERIAYHAAKAKEEDEAREKRSA